LEAQLEEQCNDADNAISQWQESYSALEAQNLELESQSIERVREIELTVKNLEGQLEEQSNDFDNAISHWNESYGALEDRNSELENQLETIAKNGELVLGAEAHVEAATEPQEISAAAPQGSVVTEMASLKSQLDEEREAHTSTQSQLVAIRKELEDFTVESEEIVYLWKGEYSLVSRIL
jgi:chromosome segregation ATPase